MGLATVQTRIDRTSRTSRRSAVSLCEELGYQDAEDRADRFLNGEPITVYIEPVDRDVLPKNWRQDYRVRVTFVKIPPDRFAFGSCTVYYT